MRAIHGIEGKLPAKQVKSGVVLEQVAARPDDCRDSEEMGRFPSVEKCGESVSTYAGAFGADTRATF